MKKRMVFLDFAALVILLTAGIFIGCNNPADNTDDGSSYTIIVYQSTGGTVSVTVNGKAISGNTGKAKVKDTIIVNATVTPDSGYKFDKFAVTGVQIPSVSLSIPSLSFIMPAASVTIAAEFSISYDVFINQSTGGTLTGAVNGTAINGSAGKAKQGDTVKVSATVESGAYIFKNFEVDGLNTSSLTMTTSPLEFVMPAGPVSVRAIFHTSGGEVPDQSISLVQPDGGTIVVNINGIPLAANTGTASPGDKIVVNINPESASFVFIKFIVSGVLMTPADLAKSPLEFIMPANQVSIGAELGIDDSAILHSWWHDSGVELPAGVKWIYYITIYDNGRYIARDWLNKEERGMYTCSVAGGVETYTMTASLIADNVFAHASGGNPQKFPPQISVGTMYTGGNTFNVTHWHASNIPKVYIKDGCQPINVPRPRGGEVTVTVNGINIDGTVGAGKQGDSIVVAAAADTGRGYDFERFYISGADIPILNLYANPLSFKMPAEAITITVEFFKDGDIVSKWYHKDGGMDYELELLFYNDGTYICTEQYKGTSTEMGEYDFDGDALTGAGAYVMRGTYFNDNEGTENLFSDQKDPYDIKWLSSTLPEPGMSKGTVAVVTLDNMDVLHWHTSGNGTPQNKKYDRQPLD